MRNLGLAIFTIAIICTYSLNGFAAGFNHSSAKQAIMLDFTTGMVLFEKQADEKMPTSSMSKVITMYMVFIFLNHRQSP